MWHGFVCEEDISSAWAALLHAVMHSLPTPSKAPGPLGPHLREFPPAFCHELTAPGVIQDSPIPPFDEAHIISMLHQCSRKPMKRALECLSGGDASGFFALAVPILERQVRAIFADVNRLPEVQFASRGTYFSTLDGVGQANKHHVMLHDVLHDPGSSSSLGGHDSSCGPRNALLDKLGSGAIALLRDVFQYGGLRAVLCHGKATASHESGCGDAPRLLLACFTALFDPTLPTVSFYKPRFDPKSRALVCALKAFDAMHSLCVEATNCSVCGDAESGWRVTWGGSTIEISSSGVRSSFGAAHVKAWLALQRKDPSATRGAFVALPYRGAVGFHSSLGRFGPCTEACSKVRYTWMV